jgi:sulfur-oxidizing protein SoxY
MMTIASYARGVLLAAQARHWRCPAAPARAQYARADGSRDPQRRAAGEIQKGKVTLDLPPLVENGNTVSMSVTVDSPMTRRTTSRRSTCSTRRTRSRT